MVCASLARLLGVNVPSSWPPEHHDEGVLQWLRTRLAAGAPAEWLLSFMILRQSQTVVGTIGLTGPPVDGTVECGYSVLPEHRRRGYTFEALTAVVKCAFDHRDVDRIIAHTFPHLQPSIGVLEKTGFKFAGPGDEEGTIRYILER